MDERFSIRDKNYHQLLYIEGDHVLTVEADSREDAIPIHGPSIVAWEPPYDHEDISQEKRNEVLANIVDYCSRVLKRDAIVSGLATEAELADAAAQENAESAEDISRAIEIYYGVGVMESPPNDLNRLIAVFGEQRAKTLQRVARRMLKEANHVHVDWMKLGAEEDLRNGLKQQHPELSDKAVSNIVGRITYSWR